MVVGELAASCDVLVIGSGPGGYVVALRLARAGRQVTLVERDHIGGTCLNIGCIPSKVLIHTADVAHLPTLSEAWGVRLTAELDLNAVHDHIGNVVATLTSGINQLLEAAGVTLIAGTARFSRRQRVAIISGDSVQHLEFADCIVATGSRPVELAELPVDDKRVFDSTGALRLTDVPENLVVVGAGYIGLELGTAWAKLGSNVTIIEAADRILPEMDRALASVVARRLTELGVTVHTNTVATGIDETNLILDAGGSTSKVAADAVIVAVGRRPNTDDLGLDRAGVTLDDRGLVVVEADRRAAPRVLAIGDITPGPALAHKAIAEAEVAARAILTGVAAFDPAAIPAVIFSDPEIASIGVTRDEAEASGQRVKEFRFPFAAGSRSRTIDDTSGFVQMLADEQGTVVGVHMAGAGVSELATAAALAIEVGVTVEELAATIHPHPTMSEAMAEAAHGLMGLPLHIGVTKGSVSR